MIAHSEEGVQHSLFKMQMQEVEAKGRDGLVGACLSPSEHEQQSVPYLVDLDYEAAYESVLETSADMAMIDIASSSELRQLYYEESRLRRLVRKLETARRRAVAAQALEECAWVMGEEWKREVGAERGPQDARLLLLKVDNDLTEREAATIAGVVNSSSVDGVVVGGPIVRGAYSRERRCE